MKQVTLQIPDKKYQFFIELTENLGFVKKISEKEKEPSKEQILKELKDAVIELKLIEKGKLKARPLWVCFTVYNDTGFNDTVNYRSKKIPATFCSRDFGIF